MENKIYDNAITTAMINIFTLSKDKEIISFKNFNKENVEHLALFEVGLMARQLFGFEIRIQTSLFTFLWLKRKFKFKKGIKRAKKKEECKIDCYRFIEDIELAYEKPKLFRKIYHEYYER